MKNIRRIISMVLTVIMMLLPLSSLGATGHIDGCTNTDFSTNCCTKTFIIIPKTGYRVLDVIVNGVSKGAITSYTFTNITGPQNLKVITEPIGGTTPGGGTGGDVGGGGTLPEGQYKVKFSANGGVGTMESQIFTEGTTQYLNANTYTKEHCHPIGWALTPDGPLVIAEGAPYSATEDTTLYTVWETNVYRVTFDANGGTGSMTQDFTYGVAQNLKNNTAITLAGGTFKGWSTTPTGGVQYANGASYSATSDVTLYAVWETTIYTITYDLAGGTLSGSNPTTYTVLSDSITLINPTKPHYVFTGWTGSNGSTPNTTVTIPKGSTENRTYTANWETVKHNVSITVTGTTGGTGTVTADGVSLNTGSNLVGYGSTIYTKGTGYGVWIYVNGKQVVYEHSGFGQMGDYTFTLTGDTQIRVERSVGFVDKDVNSGWPDVNRCKIYITTSPVTVTFDANGGTGTMAPQSYLAEVAQNLSTNTFTKTDYTFKGWSTTPDGAVTYTDGKSCRFANDVTLYAVWSKTNYTVSINLPSDAVSSGGAAVTLNGTKYSTATNGLVSYQVLNGSTVKIHGGRSVTMKYKEPGMSDYATIRDYHNFTLSSNMTIVASYNTLSATLTYDVTYD